MPDWRRLVAYVPAESGWWAEDVAAHESSIALDWLDRSFAAVFLILNAGLLIWLRLGRERQNAVAAARK